MLAPNSLVLYVDRVEELKPHALLKSGQAAIGFGQVAQVRVDKGLKWSDLVVESAGGHVVKVEGMQKADAETARAAITEAVAAWRQHQQAPTPATAALSVADELAKLAKLRDAGVLSEEEFAAQKSRLLT